jgi:hypothetical protein
MAQPTIALPKSIKDPSVKGFVGTGFTKRVPAGDG